ncbi:MAG: immunity 53 family protein [Luteolibacter sp.]
MKTTLQKLADWYAGQCHANWEHGYGIKIETIDNPGFAIDIDLRETFLESAPYPEKKDSYDTEDRWMICRRTEFRFEGRGAPSRLEDMIEEFLRWSENQKGETIPTK